MQDDIEETEAGMKARPKGHALSEEAERISSILMQAGAQRVDVLPPLPPKAGQNSDSGPQEPRERGWRNPLDGAQVPPAVAGAARAVLLAAAVAACEAFINQIPRLNLPPDIAIFVPALVLALRAAEGIFDQARKA